MKPPVAPVALDHLAGAVGRAGYEVKVVDLNFAEDARDELRRCLAGATPRLVGLTFRNSDDCFWPSGAFFVPRLVEFVNVVRGLTDAPIVLGGAGFTLFPQPILEATGCEFGIQGDGEEALVLLLRALEGGTDFNQVPGLCRRGQAPATTHCPSTSPPPRSTTLSLDTSRSAVDNLRYLREGGQIGLETKRGCDRTCTYCVDPLIKGTCVRTRAPEEVAAEVENLLRRGVDVLHLCDSEFNIPYEHALAVCREFADRGLGRTVRWYTYASVVPFSDELAGAMREAGCVGINFGADSANAEMLATYGRKHRKEDIAAAVRLCRAHGIRVMIDLLLGGPGETQQTVRETIEFMKQTDPDCVGAALGVRLYPGTWLATQVAIEGPFSSNPNLRRPDPSPSQDIDWDTGDVADLLLPPVFYISEELGGEPGQLVRDIIGGDERFFEPVAEQGVENYNYNENLPLVEAIRNGARGAYWDILRRMRTGRR